MDPLFEIPFERAPTGSREAAQRLFVQLGEAIEKGRLAPGARLPATRKSREFFGVSRNTAAEVYERLLGAGYVVSRRGSGTYVANRLPPRRAVDAHPAGSVDGRLNPFWLAPTVTAAMGFWNDPPGSAPGEARPPIVDFRAGIVDSQLFPHDVFRRASAKQLRGLERQPAGPRSPHRHQGNQGLREAVTHHLALTRAVACRPEDILVTAGAQQAFDLLARTLVMPGETIVAIEDPGYPPLRVPFAAAGARLVPVPVDDEGLMVERLPVGVGVICVTPSHQFPLGVAMSTRRRKALIRYALEHRAVIVEDDYDGEFRFEGSPLEALKAADDAGVVFYVGTFSKCMLPSLRLGFIIAPAWAKATLTAAKTALDWHCPTPVQVAVAAFISDGHLGRHVRKMRQAYDERRQLVLDALQDRLSRWLAPTLSFYGMHVTALTRTPVDLEAVARALMAIDVRLHTLQRFYFGPPGRTGLVIGYGLADPSRIEMGLEALRDALAAA
jgi:GntR family transcriptional regulator/MocR family aminotransferase